MDTPAKTPSDPATSAGLTIVILVAAGKSERMQADMAKPYMMLGNETVLRRTVKNFMQHPEIDGVRVVIRREHHAIYKKAVEGVTLFPCVVGGNTRQDSVRLGLESIAHRNPQYVLIHDIARPFPSHALISRVLAKLKEHDAVIPVLKTIDTIKRIENGIVSNTLEREHLYTVQTPQGFHFRSIFEAHQKLKGQSLPDDAAIIEKTGGEVATVEGEKDNIKITTIEDIQSMQSLLNLEMETRVGMGYDVHPLHLHDSEKPIVKQTVKLCGVRIPHTHYLVGHSDADVGLHALVDAILGAMGDGDIGTHFPPDDAQWRGADSGRFLMHAYELLSNHGGVLVHLDLTLICEHPKIAPHRQEMIEHISQILKISHDRISIKATTTEKLGFIGRGEGIAAQAVATVRLPRVYA